MAKKPKKRVSKYRIDILPRPKLKKAKGKKGKQGVSTPGQGFPILLRLQPELKARLARYMGSKRLPSLPAAARDILEKRLPE